MKILVVSQYYHPEATPVTGICRALRQKGHEVTVITDQPNYGFWKILPNYSTVFEETIDGVKVKRVKTSPRTEHGKIGIFRNYLSFHRNSKKLVRKMKEEYDIVLSLVLSPIIAASAANLYAKKHKVRHVHYCMDLWPESVVATGYTKKGSLLYRILRKWSRDIYKKMDVIVVSSPSFSSYFKEELSLDPATVFVPQPVEATSIDGSVSSPSFAYVGNLGTIQMIDGFIEAFRILNDEGVDFAFDIYGSGSEEGRIRSLIEEKGLVGKIHLKGSIPMDGVNEALKDESCLLLGLNSSSNWVNGTIPNKFISYLGYGKPIIGSLGEDGAKILKKIDGNCAVSSEPNAIASSLKWFLKLNEEERKAIGAKAREAYEASFRCDEVLVLLERVLKEQSEIR